MGSQVLLCQVQAPHQEPQHGGQRVDTPQPGTRPGTGDEGKLTPTQTLALYYGTGSRALQPGTLMMPLLELDLTHTNLPHIH